MPCEDKVVTHCFHEQPYTHTHTRAGRTKVYYTRENEIFWKFTSIEANAFKSIFHGRNSIQKVKLGKRDDDVVHNFGTNKISPSSSALATVM